MAAYYVHSHIGGYKTTLRAAPAHLGTFVCVCVKLGGGKEWVKTRKEKMPGSKAPTLLFCQHLSRSLSFQLWSVAPAHRAQGTHLTDPLWLFSY